MATRGRLVLAVVGIAVLVTCAYKCTSAEPAGAPLWTADDLPTLPPARDNGWQSLQDALTVDLVVPELPDEVEDIVAMLHEREPEESWELLRAQRITLEKLVESPAVADALESWHHAVDAPAFADACPMTITSDCRQFDMFRLHRVAMAEAMWHAARGDEATALERTTAMIDQQGRYLRSARGPMSGLVSVTMLKTTLAFSAMLGARIDDGAEVPVSVRERHRGAVEALDLDPSILERIVIGEYLYARDALAQIENVEGSQSLGDTFWPPRWLHDPSHAAARLDEAYEPVMALARDPAAPVPEAVDPTWSERVLHPVSATLMLSLDPRRLLAGQVADMRDELSELQTARNAVLRD